MDSNHEVTAEASHQVLVQLYVPENESAIEYVRRFRPLSYQAS